MARADLKVTGQDVGIFLTLDGSPVGAVSQVTNFEAQADIDEVETKPLGTDRKYLNEDVTGWSGTVEFTIGDADIADFFDQYQANSSNRSLYEIAIRQQVNYRGGATRDYVYKDCEFSSWRTTARRGEAVMIRADWKTGVPDRR